MIKKYVTNNEPLQGQTQDLSEQRLLFYVCAPWVRSDACKSRTCPGKIDIVLKIEYNVLESEVYSLCI